MAQLKGKVLAGKVLVKPHEAEAKTASGIIIPDSAKEKAWCLPFSKGGAKKAARRRPFCS